MIGSTTPPDHQFRRHTTFLDRIIIPTANIYRLLSAEIKDKQESNYAEATPSVLVEGVKTQRVGGIPSSDGDAERRRRLELMYAHDRAHRQTLSQASTESLNSIR